MAILDEIKNEILKNQELDGNEKICLIALLCSSDVKHLDELADLMGVTRNTSQMTVRSLRLKGYLKDSQIEADEAEITALRKLMSREKPIRSDLSYGENSYLSQKDFTDETSSSEEIRSSQRDETIRSEKGASAAERAEKLSKALDLNTEGISKNSYKSRAAALYKKDSNVARAAQKIKNVNILDYDADDVMESLESQHHDTKNNLSGSKTFMKSQKSEKSDRNQTSQKSEKSHRSEKPLSPEDQVMNLVEESITRSEAAIILGFAGGDYEKVEATYKRIRGTQIKDKVDALVKLLQAD